MSKRVVNPGVDSFLQDLSLGFLQIGLRRLVLLLSLLRLFLAAPIGRQPILRILVLSHCLAFDCLHLLFFELLPPRLRVDRPLLVELAHEVNHLV